MILKGSQRAGAKNLSDHLMNDRDNDHVTLLEVRGFIACDLHGALAEAHAISKGTKCEQFMFSLSLSPPKDAEASEQDLMDAVERAEQALGLDGQPRAIVFHEKEGRRHAHAVWSRIDASSMTAINMTHFKTKLTNLSRDLYLDHGWELPNGLRRDGGKSPLNFTLDEWQQAKRLNLDPREIKQSFQEAWQRSDGLKGFQNALEERGYFLAKGDRRGFVALDVQGEVFSVPRMLSIKTKEVKAKLGSPDELNSVDDTRDIIRAKLTDTMHEHVAQIRERQSRDFEPLHDELKVMRHAHRTERQKLKDGQEKRWQEEAKARSDRLNKGLRGLFDHLTGRAASVSKRNAFEAAEAVKRDRDQRELLFVQQLKERRGLEKRFALLQKRHVQDRRLIAQNVRQAFKSRKNHLNDLSGPQQRGLELSI